MVTGARKTGDKGEDIAAAYLESKGYRLLDRNFSSKLGEIDIICLKDESIIFVEVKIDNPDFPALERVNRNKLEKIKKSGLLYLKIHSQYDKLNIRFDLIIVDKFTSLCEHYPGVYFD